LVHAEMLRQLQETGASLDAIYHCPLAPTNNDDTAIEHPDRKPGPGMLLRGAGEHGVDLARSWMVGDSIRDLLAGRNAGCRGGVLVRTGHVRHAAAAVSLQADEHLVDDFAAATEVILASS
jgi:D-glycero-D-manno-heptose 1,7-bisphosphate phosphatase